MKPKRLHKPPQIASWMLSHMRDYDMKYSSIGDFEEFYNNKRKADGIFKAYFWYWSQVFYSLPSYILFLLKWRIIMFRNYLKISLRNLRKFKGFSFINISGLAIGISSCILMLLWVQDELSYDNFHENGNRIYRVISNISTSGQITKSARTPNPLGPVLKDEYPEITQFVRFQGFEGWMIKYNDMVFINDLIATADPSFLEIFTFSFIKGDPETALNEQYSLVVTEDFAGKYFGDEEPIGKVVKIENSDFKVTALIENIPQNSHIQFDLLFPIENMNGRWHRDFTDWKTVLYYTYITLEKESNATEVGDKISGVVNKHLPESNAQISLQPLKDVHLHSGNLQMDLDNANKGNMNYVYIFSFTAFCIFLIACINYMNLSTARSSKRAKEVGMRKVTGARKKDIILQFFGESILLSFIALASALILTFFFLPVFNSLSGKELALDFSNNMQIVLWLIIITLITGLLSGSYPALYLSSFRPVNVLKGPSLKRSGYRSPLRIILVVIQFTFTIILIIGTGIIYNQLNYISSRDLGYEKDYILYFPALRGAFERDFDTVKNDLERYPDILNVTRSMPPSFRLWDSMEFDWEGKNPDERVIMYPCPVDYYYLETFKIEIADGRFFSREFSSDAENYLINEAAAKAMGMESPIGKRFSYEGREGRIIGILKDFHQLSLHSEIEPLVFCEPTGGSGIVCVKINSKNVAETLDFLKSKWKEYVPEGYPFDYTFLDEAIDNFYKTERKVGSVSRYFTFLALFISCLGLFGLASFIADQRTKEIGIRKVLGASVSGVTLMLSKEFTKWVLIANVFAWPIAYFTMNRWLQNFAYRITIGVDVFILSAVLALIIAVVTVSYQAVKAARSNPVESLRYE